MMMVRFFLINQALNGTKLFHVAGDGKRAFLIEAIFFLCLLKQVDEERMIEVNDRNHKSLLILALTHHDGQASFWDVLLFLMMMEMEERPHREMKIHQMMIMVLFPCYTHVCICDRC